MGRINHDKFLLNQTVKGSVGYIVKFVGALGVDTVTKQITTATTRVFSKAEITYKWRNMADNSTYVYYGGTGGITSVTPANVKIANADTGGAIQQTTGEIN